MALSVMENMIDRHVARAQTQASARQQLESSRPAQQATSNTTGAFLVRVTAETLLPLNTPCAGQGRLSVSTDISGTAGATVAGGVTSKNACLTPMPYSFHRRNSTLAAPPKGSGMFEHYIYTVSHSLQVYKVFE